MTSLLTPAYPPIRKGTSLVCSIGILQEGHCTGLPASRASGGLTYCPGGVSARSAGFRTPAQSAQKLAPSGLVYPQWVQTKEADIPYLRSLKRAGLNEERASPSARQIVFRPT